MSDSRHHYRDAFKHLHAARFDGGTSGLEGDVRIIFSPRVLKLMKELNKRVCASDKQTADEEAISPMTRKLVTGKPVPVAQVIATISAVSEMAGGERVDLREILNEIRSILWCGDSQSPEHAAITVTVVPRGGARHPD